MSIQIKSPTRIDLAGGTLDCWPLYNFIGSCWTVNLSISVYTGAKLNLSDDKKLRINIKDLNYEKEFENYNEFIGCPDKELSLIKATVSYFGDQGKGFELETYSQSPVGGGLGGSSSLVISMLKAFAEAYNKNWELLDIVNVGHNIEAFCLNTPTGTQDYVPAAQVGLNLINYSYDGMNVKAVDYDQKYLADRMIVVFTGKSHHSGINNWQVVKGAVEGDTATLNALREVAEISLDMKNLCEKGDWESLPDLFQREYRARLKLSSSFSSPEIIELEKIALRCGADAVKICGAGGGGCVMIWCPPERKKSVTAEISSQGYQVIAAEPLKN